MTEEKTTKRKFMEDSDETKKDFRHDLLAFAEHVRENPVLYLVSIGIIAVAALAGLAFRLNADARQQEVSTALARAFFDNTDLGPRGDALAKITGDGPLVATAQYLAGESYFKAEQYDKARECFEKVRSQFGTSEYAPEAIEGLGFVAEQEGKLDEALALYQEVAQKRKDSFAGVRQGLNLGRVYEQQNKFAEASAAYQTVMTEFPGSHSADKAKAALDRLRAAHPEAFPMEQAATPEPSTAPPAAS